MLKLVKVKKEVPVSIQVRLAIPNGPSGTFVMLAKHKTKPEIEALSKRGLTDEELLREVAIDFEGLGTAEGSPLTGEAAFTEVLQGDWSQYLCGAAVTAYFEHFSVVLAKNSRR